MRLAFLMTIAVCWLCPQFNQCIQLMRPGSDGRPICTPPITHGEIDAGHAARAERIRAGATRRVQGPAVALPLTPEADLLESILRDVCSAGVSDTRAALD